MSPSVPEMEGIYATGGGGGGGGGVGGASFSSLAAHNKPYGFCGRKATLNQYFSSKFRSCVEVEVAVLGFPS